MAVHWINGSILSLLLMFTCSQLLPFYSSENLLLETSAILAVFSRSGLFLSLGLIHTCEMLGLYLLSRKFGKGAGDSGVPGIKSGMVLTPISSWILTHRPVISDWLPGPLVPAGCFPPCLQLRCPPGVREMVLVLGRFSIFKGPNNPKTVCFSRPRVMDGAGARWMASTSRTTICQESLPI